MADAVQNATRYRDRLRAEIAKVDAFVRMAEVFFEDGAEPRLWTDRWAETSSKNDDEDATPLIQFDRVGASLGGGG